MVSIGANPQNLNDPAMVIPAGDSNRFVESCFRVPGDLKLRPGFPTPNWRQFFLAKPGKAAGFPMARLRSDIAYMSFQGLYG